MLRRLLLTIATTSCLSGLCAIYTVVMRPVLSAPQELPPEFIASETVTTENTDEHVRIAETYLAKQPWAKDAKYHLRTQQAYLLTNDWKPDGKQGRVKLEPFAMAWVWTDDVGVEQAVTLVSESAVVKFAGKFDLRSPDPGRVISAALEGRTQIRGPDGLEVNGQRFFFSEPAERLWSDHPIHFVYAGSVGQAERFQADLIPQAGPPGKDRPHIFGLRNIRLSQDVRMKLALQSQGKAVPIQVRCSGSFDYDIAQRTAVFTNNVQASQETSPGQHDWIDCDRLAVFLKDKATSQQTTVIPPAAFSNETPYQRINTALEFQRLIAETGKPLPGDPKRPEVKLVSHQHQMTAWLQQLIYDVEQRQVVLTDVDGVRVRQGNTQLRSPEITLVLREDSKLQSAVCLGPGTLNGLDEENKEIVFAADWRESLKYALDPQSGLDTIVLNDSASVRRPQDGTALGADVLRVWFSPLESSAKGSPVAMPQQTSTIRPRRVEAAGTVALLSTDLQIHHCRQLDVSFEPHKPGSQPPAFTRRPAPATDDKSQTIQPAGFFGAGGAADGAPVLVGADQIHVRLQDAADPKAPPGVLEVDARGTVSIQQQRPGKSEPLSITGSRVHLENTSAVKQLAHVFGEPAHIRDVDLHIEGKKIHVDRGHNMAWVEGAGLLQRPVDKDLDGKPLPERQMLDVFWNERMTFDGQLAAFSGDTRTLLGDRSVQCDQLQVNFVQRFSFTEERPRNQTVDLAWVHCKNHVRFENRTREENRLNEVQLAEVFEMRIDRQTGDITAQGPGWMKLWRRGQPTRATLGSAQSARANQPQQIDAADWEYTRVTFEGRMTGHLQHRHATFHDDVRIVYGPVTNPNAEVDPDQPPKNGGTLQCKQLELRQRSVDGEGKPVVELVGRGNTHLEGNGFYALADEISYDQARKTYILRALGRNNVRLWRERGPGIPPEEFAQQRLEFNPESNIIDIQGVSSGGGSR